MTARRLAQGRIAESPVQVEHIGLDGQSIPLPDASCRQMRPGWTPKATHLSVAGSTPLNLGRPASFCCNTPRPLTVEKNTVSVCAAAAALPYRLSAPLRVY